MDLKTEIYDILNDSSIKDKVDSLYELYEEYFDDKERENKNDLFVLKKMIEAKDRLQIAFDSGKMSWGLGELHQIIHNLDLHISDYLRNINV